MIPELVKLGAYFSISGYFARETKARQRESFRQVPPERLLLETDAPDMCLPRERLKYLLAGENQEEINHPGNLPAVYEFTADLIGTTVPNLARQTEENFQHLFGGVLGR